MVLSLFLNNHVQTVLRTLCCLKQLYTTEIARSSVELISLRDFFPII